MVAWTRASTSLSSRIDSTTPFIQKFAAEGVVIWNHPGLSSITLSGRVHTEALAARSVSRIRSLIGIATHRQYTA